MDFTKLTLKSLKEKCKELGIKGYSNKKREELIKIIEIKSKPIIINDDNYQIGDNIDLIKELSNETIDLIYLDPPYNTRRDFYDFEDKFKNKNEYIEYMKLRLYECHRVLKKTGTIVIHIEPKISHYFRFICDEIFGDNNFRNEIIWKTGGNAKNKYKLNRFHDNLIVYSKTNKQTFNPLYFDYDEEYKKNRMLNFAKYIKKNM